MDVSSYYGYIPEHEPSTWRNDNNSTSSYIKPVGSDTTEFWTNSDTNITTLSSDTLSGLGSDVTDALARLRIVTADDLDPETTDNWYFDIVEMARAGEYDNFLKLSLPEAPTVREAILTYLASLSYDEILPVEEKFLYACLTDNNIEIKESALNTLLEWDNFYDYSLLMGLSLGNKYLDDDLKEFLGEHGY